jgi:ABC-type glycerol-3-phosphate transport system permease component
MTTEGIAAPAAGARAQTRTKPRAPVGKLLAVPGLIALWVVMSLVTIVPVYWMLVMSFRTRVELFDAPTWVIRSVTWENFQLALNAANVRYLVNSTIIASGNAILVVVLATLASYALSRFPGRANESIFFWTITNRMAPPAAFLLPLFLLYTQVFKVGDFMLFDTRVGLILLYCTFNLPLAIWLLKGVMDGIPTELDEAARIDGAGLWGTLFRVILPLAAPGIAVAGILCWIFAWNEFLLAVTLTSNSARTITTGLAEYVTVTGTNWGELAALSSVAMVPPLVVLIFAQRYIVAGLTFGATK